MRVRVSRSFSNSVTCVVINLDSRPDRWRRIRFICRLHGIVPIRFSAHDRDRGRSTFPDSTLAPAELGIWSSFVAVLKLELDTEWILVLEDDAVLVPGFRKRALKMIRRSSPHVLSIRMGWNGCLNWSSGLPFPKYLFDLVRRIPRCIWRHLRNCATHEKEGSLRLYGSQANLIRRKSASELVEILGNGVESLDVALIDAEKSQPDRFLRSRRNLAWQWPDQSDIQEDFLERIRRNSALNETR